MAARSAPSQQLCVEPVARGLPELHSKVASGDPLIFEMHNEAVGKKLFAGVLEFSGEEHNCVYVPGHIMHNLGACRRAE